MKQLIALLVGLTFLCNHTRAQTVHKDLSLKGVSMGMSLDDFTQEIIKKGLQIRKESERSVEGTRTRDFVYLYGSYWKFLAIDFIISAWDDLRGVSSVCLEGPEIIIGLNDLIEELDKKYGQHKLEEDGQFVSTREYYGKSMVHVLKSMSLEKRRLI